MEKCKQSNLQEIKALKRVFVLHFSLTDSRGSFFFVSFDSDGEAPRGPQSANDRAY